MSFYKILVEPAKSSKGVCKVCNRNIDQDTLRLQVADDRELNEYIQNHGGRSQFHGEGMSRGGYIQTENGCISVKRYFVHLDCYTPITPHPFQMERFRLEHVNAKHRSVFNHWLEQKQKEPVRIVDPPKKKRKGKKQSDDEEEYGSKKTKRISKIRIN